MRSYSLLISLILLAQLASSLSLKDHQESLAEFCWKDSQVRGVGTIPTECASGRVKIGLLCYSNCPSGYTRVGFDCQQNCLSGWANQGLFCRLTEYGRGAGYPWKFGDWFNDNGMIRRCQAANGKGKCQKWGLIYYPKCKPGYSPFGCCICRPAVPNCAALGFNGNVDLSCAKKLIIGDPVSMTCAAGLEYDAGLCYKSCGAGLNPVGPVCWGNPPAGWVNCGMGAAKDTATCAQQIFDQVAAVGNLALNIATFGTGKAVKLTKDAAQAAELKKKFETLKKLKDNSEKVQDLISKAQGKFPAVEAGKSVNDIFSANTNDVTPEDIVRVTAEIASLADPTGIADVVSAYTFPKCSKIN